MYGLWKRLEETHLGVKVDRRVVELSTFIENIFHNDIRYIDPVETRDDLIETPLKVYVRFVLKISIFSSVLRK